MTAPPPIVETSELVADPSERAERAAAVARRWLDRPAMDRLVAVFGGDREALSLRSSDGAADWLHLQEELPDWLVARLADPAGADDASLHDVRRVLGLERFAADRFNFRSRDGVTYTERHESSSGDFSERTARAVTVEATALGLTGASRPRLDHYDATLVLGGGWRSPLLRARYAASWRRAGVDLGTPYFLGSPRFLMAEPGATSEREVTADYAPGATDEFELLVGAAGVEFGAGNARVTFVCGCTGPDRICARWPHRETPAAAETPPQYTHERVAELDGGGVVLSAATGRPPYRPDTTDTLALWARVAHPAPGQRVLVVTTQVFVPFQTFDSVKRLSLPHGVDVDVVGYSADWGDRPETPEYLLQETLSAIRSARRLLVETAAPKMPRAAG